MYSAASRRKTSPPRRDGVCSNARLHYAGLLFRRVFSMVNSGALFRTEGEAEKAILLYSKIESKVIESAKNGSGSTRQSRGCFPGTNHLH